MFTYYLLLALDIEMNVIGPGPLKCLNLIITVELYST